MNPQGGNKMAEMPINKLLLNMGAPMMISMLGQALYNVVDTFFVSHIPDTAQVTAMGDKAINALTLAFPVQMLIIALGVGTGVGINALVAKSLGCGDKEQANRTAGNAILVTLCYFVLIFVFGLAFSRAFIASQTADAVIADMGTTYLRIITVFSFGSLGYMCLEKIVMATGKTTITMICQLAGALTNIILDPVMIYGLLGCPAMGIAGAACATVIGQFVSLAVIAVAYFKKGVGIDTGIRYLAPHRRTLQKMFAIGLPAIIMQILTPIMSYAMNLILGTISVSAVTAYGVYYKLQNFIFMPGYGLNNALIPIISYNYGAGKKTRVSQAIRWGAGVCFCHYAGRHSAVTAVCPPACGAVLCHRGILSPLRTCAAHHHLRVLFCRCQRHFAGGLPGPGQGRLFPVYFAAALYRFGAAAGVGLCADAQR